jgi:DNA-binding NarL/FixJ family response regulator
MLPYGKGDREGSSGSRNTMTILIADDNVKFRSRLASILGAFDGITIVGETGDVAATLEALQVTKPDILILDIHMPGGNGLDVLAVAKATKPAPIVIMLTVGPRDEYQTESFMFGADYFFEKSSELRTMAEMLKRMGKNGKR